MLKTCILGVKMYLSPRKLNYFNTSWINLETFNISPNEKENGFTLLTWDLRGLFGLSSFPLILTFDKSVVSSSAFSSAFSSSSGSS
jgi:hypothetical protein